MKEIVYCSRLKKKNLGLANILTFQETISNEDATKMRDAYKNRQSGKALAVNVFLTCASAAIGGSIKKLGTAVGAAIGFSGNFGMAFFEDYLESLDNDLDKVATSGSKFNKVEVKYRWKQRGQDGYYYMYSVKLL